MSKRCRLVTFNQEVSGPGEAVGHHRPKQRVPGMPNHKRPNQRTQAQPRSRGTHGAVARIAVLAQVEAEELFVIGKTRLGFWSDALSSDALRNDGCWSDVLRTSTLRSGVLQLGVHLFLLRFLRWRR